MRRVVVCYGPSTKGRVSQGTQRLVCSVSQVVRLETSEFH